ncbi:mitochondrial 37S ribosomal protein uS9m MRPS9 [Sporobolomyces koalae]|uniref:mitochondrial 37S ribosomal protein uS9m MRPS9 n=1 Tax=Sporobolomyces koalae TaxID=500713 RepID=UPI00317D1988
MREAKVERYISSAVTFSTPLTGHSNAMAQSVKSARQTLARAAPSRAASSTAFFPVQSAPSPSLVPIKPTQKPPSSQWYTARPSFNATIESLDESLTAARAHLFRQGLLPSIAAPLNGPEAEFGEVLPHPRLRRWKAAKEMSAYLRNGTDLKTAQYKRLTSVLATLEGLLPYAQVADSIQTSDRDTPSLVVDPVAVGTSRATADQVRADSVSLRAQLEEILARFQQTPAVSSTGITVERVVGKDRRLGKQDAQERTYAVGRRKESSARVWIVPTSLSKAADAAEPELGQVLINTLPIATYFSQATLREAVIKPLTLTSSLGAFNVFAIVKGGGTNAQADAVAMGLARALAEWERCQVEKGTRAAVDETWRDVLKKAELIERDPRVVERKKHGFVKSRKRPTWVKR